MIDVYVVTVRETFQTQVRVEALSQAAAKRGVLELLRRFPPDPPGYPGDPERLPVSVRRSAVAAWRDS